MLTDEPEEVIVLPLFAASEEEAAERAVACESVDPLPSIPHGLLSSAEIDDYVRNTGMIFPYERESLKSASFEMYLGGRCIYWDEQLQKHDEIVDRKQRRYVILPANSITFVEVEQTFRLPNYIAIRFNLRITHVHRGLLLGTGPLVDPGFHGKLLIPLHNLTAFEYYLDTTKALIWVEFTKTTFGFVPKEEVASKKRQFRPFPKSNRNLTPDEYLFKARGGQPIVSSIPRAIESARNSANVAAAAATSLRRWLTGIGLISLLGGIFGLVALVYSSWVVLQNGNSLAVSASAITKDQGIASEKLDAAHKELVELRSAVDQLKTEVQSLRQNR